MLNLDTHIVIHALQGSLTAKERKLLSADTWIRKSKIVPLASFS